MSKQVNISAKEAADRLAIRELVETYAHCAESTRCEGSDALFCGDAHSVVYLDAEATKPSMELRSRQALAPVLAT